MTSIEQVEEYLELAAKATQKVEHPMDNIDEWIKFDRLSRTMGPALAKALIRAVEKLEQIYNDDSKDDNEMWSVAGEGLDDIDKILNEAKT